MGYQWLDQLCALGVSGLVLYLAFTLFRRALPALTDMSSIDSEALIATAEAVTGAGTIRRVRSRWIGSERAVDMIISVDAHLPIAQAHAPGRSNRRQARGTLWPAGYFYPHGA